MNTKPTNPKDIAAVSRMPYWLLSGVAKMHWAVAQVAGYLKYGAWNWRAKGVSTMVYIGAIERHLEAYKSGEKFDPIDKFHHMGAVMAGASIIMDAEAAGVLIDDRPPAVIDYRAKLAEAEGIIRFLQEKYKDIDPVPYHYTIKDTEELMNDGRA